VFAISFSSVPPEFWAWSVATILFTAALGFGAGVQYARSSPDRALRRARHHCARLYEIVLGTIDKAQQACSLLETLPTLTLSTDEVERLDAGRGRLLDTIVRIVERQSRAQELETLPRKATSLQDLNLTWVRTPEDPKTAVPGREAFDQNLRALLVAGAQLAFPSGLLLVTVDKLDHLKVRFGAEGADHFLRKMASLLCRSLRDQDLLCRWGDNAFGVLMPFTDAEEGRRLATGIRDTVRSYHFRLDESGPEVLVTASFGYTLCPPNDSPDLALNRASAALEKSERCGRNQLHVHDGRQTVRCLAG
jgi:diguanylate cyclase (GGDEF)-like protein